MNSFSTIQAKLNHFITKFYLNELIKGVILFFTLGVLYFIFTLLIEYFLWLKPFARTVLFWIFIVVEVLLFLFYIVLPVIKIIGLKKGISYLEASKIIGNHFPEINDKLLNTLQLNNANEHSELLKASIAQKCEALSPIPFRRAINFSTNVKFLKYTLIPIFIWLLVYLTGNNSLFNDSFTRVVDYNTQYEPPAPFVFQLENTNLNVTEGDNFTLNVKTLGDHIPENVSIIFLNEHYFLQKKQQDSFQYTFTNVKKSISFYFEASGIASKVYQLQCIATPVITNLKLIVNYPSYTGKKNQVISNTGNAIVPNGTNIDWLVETHQATDVSFNIGKQKSENFTSNSKNLFSFGKQVFTPINYQISTSNNQLQNYEVLDFNIDVTPDEYPKIIVKSDIDSITHGPVQFIGQLSDDYGLQKLQLVYYDKLKKEATQKLNIPISKSSFTDFYYVFPDNISIDEGVTYELYFEVFDNDGIQGAKKTKSRVFSFYNKTSQELATTLLKEQKETLENFTKAIDKAKHTTLEVEKFKNSLQIKDVINWNDTKKLEEFIKRQTDYQELFKEQTTKLQKNLNEQPVSEDLKEKKSELDKRIEETKKIAEQEKMLKELAELSQLLKKEDLIKKLQEVTKKNKQNKQSLERILELTKRFYVEQKANQLSEKLENLSKEQKELSKNQSETSKVNQKKINQQFHKIKDDFKDLEKQNQELNRPMDLPNTDQETEEIEEDLDKSLQNLNSQQPSGAKKNQKSAAKKMQQLSESMQQSMAAAEGESIDENIDDLRKIVENLIEFSFQQETLLDKFSVTDNQHPEYPKNIKKQQVLKEYFEHIDDSLYVLSLRLVKMSSAIQKEVSDTHYFLDESIINFTENHFQQGLSNQQFVITAANNLANSLSNLLESLMNASPSFGKGSGSQQQFSLPDIIKKQSEILDAAKQAMSQGSKKGNQKGDNQDSDSEQSSEDLYEIYKQQTALKQFLEELYGKNGNKGTKGSGDAIKKMEELEEELLEKGFTKNLVTKMQQLQYELLKLEKAKKQQGEDKKRSSKTNHNTFKLRTQNKLKLQREYFNYNEILNRQSLPLHSIYKNKVQSYFKTEQ